MSDFAVKNLKFNYIVNTLDGAFFGLGLGAASFITIVPLFLANMTDSAILIGLPIAIHTMGWQLPQLLAVGHLSRLSSFKPFVMVMTIHERIPFLGLGLVAWFLPVIGNQWGLILVFIFLIWQGLGGGFTANPWQNLICRVFPSDYIARFFGIQNAAVSLFGSFGAVAAGFFLERIAFPYGFAACFLFAFFGVSLSWYFLFLTREPPRPVEKVSAILPSPWKNIAIILKRDFSFDAFIVARIFSQIGLMAFGFYTVYADKFYQMDKMTAGLITSVLFITQVVANPLLGWVADRVSRKWVLQGGSVAILCSTMLVFFAPNLTWFYFAFIFAGLANTIFWSISMAFTLDFGTESEKPTYIGLANTLIAPATLFAQFFGGWLADATGYTTTFIVSAVAGVVTLFILTLWVHDPRKGAKQPITPS